MRQKTKKDKKPFFKYFELKKRKYFEVSCQLLHLAQAKVKQTKYHQLDPSDLWAYTSI